MNFANAIRICAYLFFNLFPSFFILELLNYYGDFVVFYKLSIQK